METNNKLIAEFMGLVESTESGLYWTEKTSKFGFLVGIGELKKLEYNNWNLLIPVVKKIREIVNVELSSDQYFNQEGISQRLNPYDYDIKSIYKGIVEFIKWYNEQTPSKSEILQEMKLHNEDEAGIDNQWTFEDAEYHLLLSDKYHNK